MRAALLSIKPKGRNKLGRTRHCVGAAGNKMDREEGGTTICGDSVWLKRPRGL
jgi:hypothetical protein